MATRKLSKILFPVIVLITPSRSAWKVCTIIPGLKMFELWGCLERKVENLSSGDHVLHTTSYLVISPRSQDENGKEMY